MTFLHKDPRQLFGQDLIQVFGPQSQRRHISQFTAQEKRDILAKIPQYVDTDDLGLRPSFFQVVNKLLTVLQQCRALVGVDLDWCNSLQLGQLVRSKSSYLSSDLAYKNNKVQRGIWLRHLVEDILFEFDPSHVLMSLARKLSDGTFNLNNGQHRTCACIILGIRDIPAEWIDSDLESVDVDLYATDNLNTLSSSEFDHFRIMVRRNQVRKSENRSDLIEKDQDRENMFDIHARYGSRFIEKGSDQVAAKECTGVGNMIKYYDNYGPEIYERAISIVCSVFSKAPLATANAWGVMELLRIQKEKGVLKDDEPLLDWMITQGIMYKYSDPRKNGMHLDIKNAYKLSPKYDKDTPEQKIISAGIYKLCKTAQPYHWEPVFWDGVNISTRLTEFKVMPLKKPVSIAA